MPALSTQGLASGIQAGFGMARQVGMDRQNEQRYEQEQLAKQQAIQTEQARYNQQFERDNTRYMTEQERLAAQDAATANYRASSLQASADSAAATADWRKSQGDIATAQSDREALKFARDNAREDGLAYIYDANTNPNFKRRPELEAELERVGLSRFNPTTYFDPEKRRVTDNLSRQIGEIVNSGDLSQANGPQFLSGLNVLLADEINNGVGEVDQDTGKQVVGKKVSGFQPVGQGQFVTEVTLEFSDGSFSEPRPVTENRSSMPDDLVKASNPEELMNMVLARKQVGDALLNNPTIAKVYGQMAAEAGITNSQKPPAFSQNLQILTSQFNIPQDQAIAILTNSKGNPRQMALEAAGIAFENQSAYGEDRKSIMDFYQEALPTFQGANAAPATSDQAPASSDQQAAPYGEGAIITNAQGVRMALQADPSTGALAWTEI